MPDADREDLIKSYTLQAQKALKAKDYQTYNSFKMKLQALNGDRGQFGENAIKDEVTSRDNKFEQKVFEMAEGGQVKGVGGNVSILEDNPTHFVVGGTDGKSFKVAKKGLSKSTLSKIQGLAKGGTVVRLAAGGLTEEEIAQRDEQLKSYTEMRQQLMKTKPKDWQQQYSDLGNKIENLKGNRGSKKKLNYNPDEAALPAGSPAPEGYNQADYEEDLARAKAVKAEAERAEGYRQRQLAPPPTATMPVADVQKAVETGVKAGMAMGQGATDWNSVGAADLKSQPSMVDIRGKQSSAVIDRASKELDALGHPARAYRAEQDGARSKITLPKNFQDALPEDETGQSIETPEQTLKRLSTPEVKEEERGILDKAALGYPSNPDLGIDTPTARETAQAAWDFVQNIPGMKLAGDLQLRAGDAIIEAAKKAKDFVAGKTVQAGTATGEALGLRKPPVTYTQPQSDPPSPTGFALNGKPLQPIEDPTSVTGWSASGVAVPPPAGEPQSVAPSFQVAPPTAPPARVQAPAAPVMPQPSFDVSPYDQMVQAIKDKAANESARADAMWQIQKQANDQAQERQMYWQDQMKKSQQHVDDAIAGVANTEIDPQRYFHNMSNWGKCMSAIGLVLGGYGSGLTGGPNMALDQLNKNIDREIESQKSTLGKKQGLISMYLSAGNSLMAAETQARADLAAITAGQLQAAQYQYGSPETKAVADYTVAQLRSQALIAHQNLVASKAKMDMERMKLRSEMGLNAAKAGHFNASAKGASIQDYQQDETSLLKDAFNSATAAAAKAPWNILPGDFFKSEAAQKWQGAIDEMGDSINRAMAISNNKARPQLRALADEVKSLRNRSFPDGPTAQLQLKLLYGRAAKAIQLGTPPKSGGSSGGGSEEGSEKEVE
jgi:hypothetical protein